MAAKNTDTREHDIADSDDYFQYHGGMVATVRALTGNDPAAYIGDITRPDAVRTRTLSEETARVFRARVVNPRWIAAMRRHGYKGAFETGRHRRLPVRLRRHRRCGRRLDVRVAGRDLRARRREPQFMREANPWALHGIVERLLEAADRGMWAEPDPETLKALQQVYLDVEGDLEDRG